MMWALSITVPPVVLYVHTFLPRRSCASSRGQHVADGGGSQVWMVHVRHPVVVL